MSALGVAIVRALDGSAGGMFMSYFGRDGRPANVAGLFALCCLALLAAVALRGHTPVAAAGLILFNVQDGQLCWRPPSSKHRLPPPFFSLLLLLFFTFLSLSRLGS